MKHRGEIVEKAVRQSGYSNSEIARRLGKSRRWMYLMFENSQVTIDSIISIGKIIHYDFSDEITELNRISGSSLLEPEAPYNWKNKYLKLLETHNELLKKCNPSKG